MIQIGAPLVGSYNYGEVARSILIAFAASYAALDLGGRVTAARGWARAAWLTGGAIAMGIGIWAMHFKGMLAFHLPVKVAYHWPTVLASLVIGVLASAIALYVATRQKMGPAEAWTGSLIIGGGIAAMHYVGMAAMRMAAVARFDPLVVALSVVLAILFSRLALMFTFDYRDDFRGTTLARLISAAGMGAAISLMHYTGMAAASFIPAVMLLNVSHTVSISPLGSYGISIVTLLVLGTVILTSSVDRRLAAQAQELQTSERFRQIADNLQIVLSLSSADFSTHLYVNRTYEKIWGRTVESLYADPNSWLEAIHPNDRGRVSDFLQRLTKGEAVDDLEYRIVRPDGSTRWVAGRGYPIFDAQGHLYRIVGSASDITERKRTEERLRREQGYLAMAQRMARMGVWSWNPSSGDMFGSEEFYRIFGIDADKVKLTREFFLQRIHPEDLLRYDSEVSTAVAKRRNWELDYRIVLPDASVKYLHAIGKPVFDKSGDILEFVGTTLDITERKRAEQELRQAEERIHAILENSSNLIFLKDTEGRYLLVNREFERALLASQEQIKGKTDEEMFPPEQAAVFRANDLEVLRAGVPMEFEEISTLEDGPHTSIVHKFPLFDTRGNIYATGGVATDITERKRAEEARRHSEEQYRTVVETAHDGVVSIDEDSQILFVNPAAVRIFGYEASELIGRPLTMLMPEFLREMHKVGLKRYLATGQRHIDWQGIELVGLRKNVEEFPVEVSFGEVTRERRRIFTGFIRDIKDRKQAEEELRKLSGRLLRLQDEERRRIGRELHDSTGQDLVALATMVGQLRSSIPPGDRKSDRLLSECKALAERCIREVRTLSYLLHPPVLDRAGLEDAIRDYVKGFIDRTGIQLELEMSPRVGRMARDIELAVFRVVQESLTNIQRHSGSKQAKIRIHRGSDLTLEISDFGRGVSASVRKEKGEPGFEVGVGIPSMQERVKLIGGRLEIDSTSHGTSVRVTIPLGENEREKPSHSDS
jgi:PAS domain S-box-containing protein